MLDTKALATATALIVREHVATALQPVLAENAALRARLDAIEGREAPALDTEAVAAIVRDAVAAIPAPNDGKDAEVDMGAVASLIEGCVSRHMAGIPTPKDGASVTIDDVRPLIDDAVGKAVSAIPVPKDGVGLAGAIIDRSGNLIVTLTDGSTRDLGPVVGRDYDPAVLDSAVRNAVADLPKPKDGDPGKDADPAAIKQMVDEAVAAIPPAKDGKDAYPGKACGLFDATAQYRALDVVSFNGSEWRAKTDDPGPLPGDGWMLSAQRGKPGKTAQPLPPLAGKAGASIIAGAFDRDAMELTLARDDGEAFSIDFTPLAEAIRAA